MRGRQLALGFLFTLTACGDPKAAQSGSGTGGSDQGGGSGQGGTRGANGSVASSSGGSSGTDGTTTVCNDLVADAPDFLISNDAGSAPAAKGGSIVDGTYFVTKETMYETSLSLKVDSGNTKVLISGSSWQEVDGWPPDDLVNPAQHITATFTTTGTTLTLHYTCPDAAEQASGFTADAQGFSLYGEDHGVPFGVTFARQ
jgi:hypothetical protein